MRPYGDHAEAYWSAGWHGVLPLPHKRKDPPPYGYTGSNGQWPSFADVFAWAEGSEGEGNLALRLPSNVLGIDVDGYSGKVGEQTLNSAIQKWGSLPLTHFSTSRHDGVSGIMLFRVPDDLRWPGEIGPGIELIQRRHRYMVAPPSVHPLGREYRWFIGADAADIPRIDDLPFLPDAWVRGITGGQLAHDLSKVWVTNEQVAAWIGATAQGALCRDVKASVLAITGKLREAKHSRHETATRGVMRLVHLGAEGHTGAAEALGIVHGVFRAVATLGTGARSPEAAGAEWERIVYGAIGVVMSDGFDVADPCTNPLGLQPAQVENERSDNHDKSCDDVGNSNKESPFKESVQAADEFQPISMHDSFPPRADGQITDDGPWDDDVIGFDASTANINPDGAILSGAQVPEVTVSPTPADVPILAHDSLLGIVDVGRGIKADGPQSGRGETHFSDGKIETFDLIDNVVNPEGIVGITERKHDSHSNLSRGDDGDSASLTISAGNHEDAGVSDIHDGKGVVAADGADASGKFHNGTIADPELAFMVEQSLLRLRANETAREIITREKAQASFRMPPSLGTLADELALPDEEMTWTISEVLPHGANVLLTAQYKTGKTTLVNHTAKALADGNDFLARYLVHPSAHRVALWNYEVSAGMYRRWMRDILIKNTDHISIANLRGYSIPLLVPTVQDFAIQWLASRNVQTWIVDPAARAMTGTDENSNVEVGQFLDALDEIKSRAGVTNLILVTHTGRAEMAQGRERARGATRFDDWADVRWLLTKDDDGLRYFRATGRDVDTDEYRLHFEPLTRSLTASDDSRPPKPRGNPSKVTDGGIADAIIRAVRDVPGQTLRTIEQNVRQQMSCRASRVYAMVKALESQSVIVAIDGPRGSRQLYPPDVARALSTASRLLPIGAETSEADPT